MERQLRGTSGGQGGDTAVAPASQNEAIDLVDHEFADAVAPQLIERSEEIDLDLEEAFEHRAELTEICRRIVGDQSLAEDVVQETYLQAVKNIHKLERRDGLMPWLVTVATRRSLNELRRRKYSTPVETMPEKQTAPEVDPCVAVTLTDEFDRVNSIMSTLTARERDLLMRQVYDGLSLVELAEMEGTSAASVRSVLSRARSKIKTAIAQSGARILLPFTFIAEKARRRLEPLMVRVDRFEMATTAAISPGEILSAGVLSVTLFLGVPTGSLPLFDGVDTVDDSTTTPSSMVLDGDGAGATTVLGRAGTSGSRVGSAGGTDAGGATRSRTGSGTGTGTGGGSGSGGQTGGTPDPGNLGNPLGEPGQGGEVPPAPEAPPAPDPTPPANDPDETYAEDGAEDDDGDIFFLGTRQGDCQLGCSNLFKSTDGGASWTRMQGRGLKQADSLLIPGDADGRIFAAGPAGLQVSLDGGDNFESVLGMSNAGSAAISPRFAKGEPRILLGSTPAAEWDDAAGQPSAWRTNLLPSARQQHFAFSPDGPAADPILFVGRAEIENNAVVAALYTCDVTAEGDLCASRVDLPLTSVPKIAVSSTFADDATVFVWGDGGALRSDDGGATFKTMAMPFSDVTRVTDDGDGTFFASGFTVTPEGPSVGGVAVSHNGGKTWRLLGEDTAVGSGTRMVEVLSDGRLLAGPVAGAGGGLYCSSDGGQTWDAHCEARAPRAPTSTTSSSTTSSSTPE